MFTSFCIDLFAKVVRSHWGIENKLHWTLDVTFREDESRIRRGNGAHNMEIIKHMALNLLKGENTKRSISGKRLLVQLMMTASELRYCVVSNYNGFTLVGISIYQSLKVRIIF
ncbi:MAG: ISAs1 family transposase [gamma proteobacterium symbiont of Taylorina sp.]|nr:ISAs1 family transposase [gamma proteobacterium symbiont of Taylorina sp.]